MIKSNQTNEYNIKINWQLISKSYSKSLANNNPHLMQTSNRIMTIFKRRTTRSLLNDFAILPYDLITVQSCARKSTLLLCGVTAKMARLGGFVLRPFDYRQIRAGKVFHGDPTKLVVGTFFALTVNVSYSLFIAGVFNLFFN